MRTAWMLMLLLAVLVPTGAHAQRVTGTATKLDRMALPPEAVFEATVQDVSRADAAATVLGAVRIENPGQVPIRFAIDVDPQKVEAAHTYAVRATITVDGRLRYTTDTHVPVLTRGAGTSVELALKPVPAPRPGPSGTQARPAIPASDSPPLEGTYWKLVRLGDTPVTTLDQRQREASLTLQAEGHRAAFTGGCNRMFSTYTLEGAHLTFGQAGGTLMACPWGMDGDHALSETLSRVHTWTIAANVLELADRDGRVVARFEAAATPADPRL